MACVYPALQSGWLLSRPDTPTSSNFFPDFLATVMLVAFHIIENVVEVQQKRLELKKPKYKYISQSTISVVAGMNIQKNPEISHRFPDFSKFLHDVSEWAVFNVPSNTV